LFIDNENQAFKNASTGNTQTLITNDKLQLGSFVNLRNKYLPLDE